MLRQEGGAMGSMVVECQCRHCQEEGAHPDRAVHQLKGQQAGLWAAYASNSLRIMFRRLDGGRIKLDVAGQHDDD